MWDKLNMASTSHKEEMCQIRVGFEEQLHMASTGDKEEMGKMREAFEELPVHWTSGL